MKDDRYTQCRLESGTMYKTAFIPSRFAEIGRSVGKWIVAAVYETVDYSSVKNRSHDSGRIWIATSGSYVIGHK